MDDENTNQTSRTAGHLRGSVVLVAGRVLAIVINLGVQVLTVRYLSKADYGVFAFALSVAGILSVLCSFGMDKAVSRFLAVYLQQHDYKRFWGMFVLMFVTVTGLGAAPVLVFVASWFFALPLLSTDTSTQLVLAIMAGLAFCNALDALFIALFAVMASAAAVFVRRHLLGPLFKLAAAVAVVATVGNVVAFATGQLVAGVLGVGICLWMLPTLLARHSGLREASSGGFIFPLSELYSYSATLLSGDLAYLLRGALVPLVLGLMFVEAEVATYQAVVPLARLNEFVLMSFSVLFLPNAAKLAAASRNIELQHLFEKTTIWVTLLSFPVFAVSFIASDSLPVLLFGQEYESSGSILAWLAVGFYANAAFGSTLRVLRATARLSTLLIADVLLIAFASALVFSLVPRYGAIGGAWAVCGTYFAQSVLYQILVATTAKVNPFTWCCVVPFAAGVGLCVVGAYLRGALGTGFVSSVLVATMATAVMLLVFARELDVLGTFPELMRLPVIRRWVPVTQGEANQP